VTEIEVKIDPCRDELTRPKLYDDSAPCAIAVSVPEKSFHTLLRPG